MNELNNPDKKSLRLSVVVPELRVADVQFNADQILNSLVTASFSTESPHLLLFPELCLTGYTCGDLFSQPLLAETSLKELEKVSSSCRKLKLWAVVGLPLSASGMLFDAAVLTGPEGPVGISLNRSPQRHPGVGPGRYFVPGSEFPHVRTDLFGKLIPIGCDLSLQIPTLFSEHICIVVGYPDRVRLTMHRGLLLNPCAIPATASPQSISIPYRQVFPVGSQAWLAYASCGPCESTAEKVYSGSAGILCDSTILAQTEPLQFSTQRASAWVSAESFADKSSKSPAVPEADFPGLRQKPFCAKHNLETQCEQILAIQAAGLIQRLRYTGLTKVVLGLSGGADSSLALLVCAQVFKLLRLLPNNIIAISMPGPGSGKNSRSLATSLAKLCETTHLIIPINSALEAHLCDIGHPLDRFDVTYENAQARERTQILMDLANQSGALVIGTGDLSEIALGWSTYNGDHMSMYAVNSGLPKTLLLEVLVWAGKKLLGTEGEIVTKTIASATISPELLPSGSDNQSTQATEEIIGPYILHDFFLFHAIGRQEPPRAVFALAKDAFDGVYSPVIILDWLKVFYRRFFSQQFKRSASPDGPQICEFSLSPRDGWAMPSDAYSTLWLSEIDSLQEEQKE